MISILKGEGPVCPHVWVCVWIVVFVHYEEGGGLNKKCKGKPYKDWKSELLKKTIPYKMSPRTKTKIKLISLKPYLHKIFPVWVYK